MYCTGTAALRLDISEGLKNFFSLPILLHGCLPNLIESEGQLYRDGAGVPCLEGTIFLFSGLRML